MDKIVIRQFDQVQLLTTKRVHYVSAPPGTKVSPDGVWTVAAVIQSDLLLTKNNITIRIPAEDVFKIVALDVGAITSHFGKLALYGEERKERRREV